VPSAIEKDEVAKTSSSVTISAGTRISVRTIDSIDSTRNRVGYRFQASLQEPLTVDGNVVVPKGADVYGRLEESKETGTFTGRSELKLELTGIVVHGQTVPLVTGQSAAQFIGQDPDERERVFRSISKMYDRRSALVHGSYNVDDYDAGRFVSAEEVDEWATYLRRALLGFLTLYFRGDVQASRDPVLERIAKASFEDAEGNKLRKEAEIETLFAELSGGSRKG
jgi:hypothetical protein